MTVFIVFRRLSPKAVKFGYIVNDAARCMAAKSSDSISAVRYFIYVVLTIKCKLRSVGLPLLCSDSSVSEK